MLDTVFVCGSATTQDWYVLHAFTLAVSTGELKLFCCRRMKFVSYGPTSLLHWSWTFWLVSKPIIPLVRPRSHLIPKLNSEGVAGEFHGWLLFAGWFLQPHALPSLIESPGGGFYCVLRHSSLDWVVQAFRNYWFIHWPTLLCVQYHARLWLNRFPIDCGWSLKLCRSQKLISDSSHQYFLPDRLPAAS